MYIIIVYDLKEERLNKIYKFLKTHLTWIQNSVFEGEVTKSQYNQIKQKIKEIINKEEDSIIIYTIP